MSDNLCNCLIEVDENGAASTKHDLHCEYNVVMESFTVAMGRLFPSASRKMAEEIRDGYIREWREGKRWTGGEAEGK